MANFAAFEAAMQKLQNIATPTTIQRIVDRAGSTQGEFMAELNVKQLLAGRLSSGARILPKYSKNTRARKKAKGQRFDVVTLRDTGAFHASIKVKKFPDRFQIIATDEKAEHLQDYYGSDILGLTAYNMRRVRARIRPLIMRDIRLLIKARRR